MSYRVRTMRWLLAGIALPLTATAGEAGLLTVVSTTTTKTTVTVAPVTGTVTVTTASTTTPLLGSVTTAAPVTAGVVTTANPVLTTTYSTPGSLTNLVNAAGSIVGNADGLVTSINLSRSVFVNPKSSPVTPKGGKIRSFSGKIRSFSGKIRSFSGEEVTPFWGKVQGFWGAASPFEGDPGQFWGTLRTYNDGSAAKAGSATPQWSRIRGFWGDIGTQWDALRTTWDGAKTSSDFAGVSTRLSAVIKGSASFWGDAVKTRTGKDFYSGFANTLLQRYGIDPANPDSLAKLDPADRDYFFLEWYDGLMQYSGADAPDYWMRQIGWSPKLTQTLGEGKDSVIGLLDFTVTGTETSSISYYDGVSTFSNGHGAAVASLMVSAHDGKGVMGIAPMASVVAYNPFDASETAGWTDLKKGIVELGKRNASIINMSLGVSGWTLHPDWNGVFADPALTLTTANSVFVIAAGNDGITQTKDIAWSNSANFVVVGSVDPNAEISEFSNRPGTTCLLTDGKCAAGSALMNRFIVAPGELLLVSDGKGGVTRMSGTSFAAPLVSGTVALIHDRWPWLAKYPKETIDIILKSATDLGAPGVDAVYGVGQLNVTAALSPLSYDKLTWYSMDDKGRTKPISSGTIKAQGTSNMARWEAGSMYFYAFETIGGSYRDFAIPLSSKLIDQSVLSAGGSKEQFQAYLYNQVTDWMKKPALRGAPSLNLAAATSRVANPYGLNISMSLAPKTLKRSLRQGEMPYQTALRLADEDNRFALQLGQGDGAIELGNVAGFGRAADYDAASGGANPLLGFASGGAFAQARYAFNARLALSMGFTGQATRYDADRLQQGNAAYARLHGYKTGAATISLSYQASPRLALTGSYTRLNERDALLGIQALDPQLLGGGSATEGMTAGFTWDATASLRLAGSGTLGRTRSGDADALISTGAKGFASTAWAMSLTKSRLFGRSDALRLSLAQPLHVEGGRLTIASVRVIDRETGELGQVRESFALPGTKRPLVAEGDYSRSLLGGQADLALFGKAQLAGRPAQNQAASVLAGARLTVRY